MKAAPSGLLLTTVYFLRVRPVDLDAVGELLGDLVGDFFAEEDGASLAAGDGLRRARVEDGEGEAAREGLARDLDDEVGLRLVARDDHAPRPKLFALAQRVLDLAAADEGRVRAHEDEARPAQDGRRVNRGRRRGDLVRVVVRVLNGTCGLPPFRALPLQRGRAPLRARR